MSLQGKFAVLLSLLGLTVLLSVAASFWSFNLLRHEVARPLSGIASSLESIGGLRAELAAQERLLTDALEGSRDPLTLPDRSAKFHVHADAAQRGLSVLQAGRFDMGHPDRFAFDAIGERLSRMRSLGDRLFLSQDAAAGRAAREDALEALSVLDRLEQRIHADAHTAIGLADRFPDQLLLVLLLAASAALLAAVLGLFLVRRWVLEPIGALRTAAARIAAGDLDHRIAVAGRDEFARLSDEVNHMTAMVRRMQDERVERERLAAVGEMVRRLAHNLRNPLSGIRGLAELTRDDLPAASELRDHQQRIITSVDRFESWLRDLLGVMSSVAVQPEPTAVRPWITSVVQSHQPAARSRGVRFDLRLDDAPRFAAFDPRHLEHALLAVVANAIESAPAGSAIEIAARPDAGDRWLLSVADRGPGIPEHLRQRVFNAYFTTKRDGNGLGLALALQVVRAHGGTLGVFDTDEKLGGSTFVFDLPLRPGAGEGGKHITGAAGGAHPGR